MAHANTLTVTLGSRDEAVLLYGPRDSFLKLVRDALGAKLVARGDTIHVEGTQEQIDQAERAFNELRHMLQKQSSLSAEDVRTVLAVVQRAGEKAGPQNLTVVEGGRHVRPRTDGQALYVQAMRDHDMTLCVGPAGSGKTYLAVGMAVTMLRQGLVKRIVLVRPAVEAGERLGFLPGDIVAKVNPYLRPLFDSLNDMMEPDQVQRYMNNDIIEIVPLAFMRGRAQPLTSKVLTPSGFMPIGALQPGDWVIGSDGRPTRIEGVFPQGVKPVYKVSFTDRTVMRCCGEHLWTVHKLYTSRPRVVQTQDIMGRLRWGHNHIYELPLLSRPVEFPPQEVPLDPYVLGLLLGDGCVTGKTTPGFATAEPELVGAFASRLPGISVRHKGGVDYVLNKQGQSRGRRPNPVTVALRELDLCGTRSGSKFVPDCYLFNTADVRLAVLQGLLDTDGGNATQEGRFCRIQYVTTSARLRDDLLFLARSLGGVAWSRVRKAEGRKPGLAQGRPVYHRADAHIVEMRLPPSISPFRLRRKADCYEAIGGGRPQKYFDRIEPDGKEETVCIRVSAEDALYVTDDFILTHNTLNNAAIILDEGQNTTVQQMKMFLTRMGNSSKIIVTGDVTQIDLPKQMRSGLIDALHRLQKIEGIAIVHLSEHDIVRHPLVQQIVRAYEDEKPRRNKE